MMDDTAEFKPLLSLYGAGEPFLSPHIYDMVEYAGLERGFPLQFHTNGLTLEPHRLARLGPTDVTFSVGGFTLEGYEMCRCGGDLNKAPEIVEIFAHVDGEAFPCCPGVPEVFNGERAQRFRELYAQDKGNIFECAECRFNRLRTFSDAVKLAGDRPAQAPSATASRQPGGWANRIPAQQDEGPGTLSHPAGLGVRGVTTMADAREGNHAR